MERSIDRAQAAIERLQGENDHLAKVVGALQMMSKLVEARQQECMKERKDILVDFIESLRATQEDSDRKRAAAIQASRLTMKESFEQMFPPPSSVEEALGYNYAGGIMPTEIDQDTHGPAEAQLPVPSRPLTWSERANSTAASDDIASEDPWQVVELSL